MEYCWNCNSPIDYCTCGNTEVWSKDGPVCPYCGYVCDPADSDGLAYEDANEYYCDNCCESFSLSVNISFTWTTRKVEP